MRTRYRGAYQIGKHKGYRALQQAKPIDFYRDGNREGRLNTSSQAVEPAVIGANIHRSNADRPSMRVGKWSAGCQVF